MSLTSLKWPSAWCGPALPLVILLALGPGGAALAHEGHDHAELPPLPAAAAGPRFTATTADLELVGSLDGETLVVFIDRYASNEPVRGARVELESGDWKAVAAPRADGAYAAPAGPLARPGSHPLVVTVEAGELSDLLQASLGVPAPPPPDTSAADERLKHALHYATGTAGGLLLAGLGVWAMRRRRGA